MLLEFKGTKKDEKVFINAEYVRSVTQNKDLTVIRFDATYSVSVTDDFKEVVGKIKHRLRKTREI